jgi:glycosyltransferase involved in cell wall biosynthesis
MPFPWRRSGTGKQRELAVSVIVAAYNTGAPLHELVRSLDGQSMPQDQFEVIVVDDGSTDGTGALLDQLAAVRENWTVRHIPNSGWPGTPRNLGISVARGEFVTFLDHDDYLGPRALETAHAYARAHGSDVVVAHEVGVGRNIGRFMFVDNVPDATFENSPIVRLLTPHKLYRRELLDRHGIRFPEGKVRLEDHQLTMQAYFAAERVSIYVDHPFYYWTYREDGAHASSTEKDPHEYVEVAVNRVLDIVEQHTEPGTRRDALMSHWLERKLLPIVARPAMLDYAPDYRRAMVDSVRQLVLERYPEHTDRHLNFSGRLRVHLLRSGDVDEMMALAREEADLTGRAAATKVCWEHDSLRVRVRAELVHRDGTPVLFRREGGSVWWEPPQPLEPSLSQANLLDVTDDLTDASCLLNVQTRDGLVERTFRVRGGVVLDPVAEPALASADPGRVTVAFEGWAELPATVLRSMGAGDSRLVLDLRTEFEVLGWRSLRRIPAPPGWGETPAGCREPEWAGQPEQPEPRLEAYATRKGNLSIKGPPVPSPPPVVRADPPRTLRRRATAAVRRRAARVRRG